MSVVFRSAKQRSFAERKATFATVVSAPVLRIGAVIAVVADAASVGSDAGSIRHDATVIAAPVLSIRWHR